MKNKISLIIVLINILIGSGLLSQVDLINLSLLNDNNKTLLINRERQKFELVLTDSLLSDCSSFYIDVPDSIKRGVQIEKEDSSCNFYIGTTLMRNEKIPFIIKDEQGDIVKTIFFIIKPTPIFKFYLNDFRDTMIYDMDIFLEKPYIFTDNGFAELEPWMMAKSYQLTIYDIEGDVIKQFPKIEKDTLIQEHIDFLKSLPKNSRICFFIYHNSPDGGRISQTRICYYYRGAIDDENE